MAFTSEIDPQCAAAFIRNYQNGIVDPATTLQSVWLNNEIINAIKAGIPGATPNDPPTDYTGVRVYLARYCQDCMAVDTNNNPCQVPTPGQLTTIVSLTLSDGHGMEKDMKFFDYGNLCPPTCNGAIVR